MSLDELMSKGLGRLKARKPLSAQNGGLDNCEELKPLLCGPLLLQDTYYQSSLNSCKLYIAATKIDVQKLICTLAK